MINNTADILIVEDELITALDMKLSLKKRGYNIIKIVASGEDAISVALETHPDLVLMDINLKGRINGLEAAQEILTNNIPVIFITAQRDQATVSRMNALCSKYVFKPFDEVTLNREITEVLH